MKPTIRHIQETVAEHFEVPMAIMTTRKRAKGMDAAPRHIAMYFARRLTGHSYMAITQRFDRKDHTTVRSADLKISRLIAENDDFAAEMKTLGAAIGSSIGGQK